jgi:dTDP-glucose 4,6-dehydratase
MKRCVIFGAAGFIFSHFYDRLKQQPDIQVFGLDAFHYAANKEYSTEMSCIDCASFDQLDYWFREYEQFNLHPIDVAVVAQSSTHVDNSKYDPFSFARNNVLGTVNVLEACRRYGVEKIFVVSTDETLYHHKPYPIRDD